MFDNFSPEKVNLRAAFTLAGCGLFLLGCAAAGALIVGCVWWLVS